MEIRKLCKSLSSKPRVPAGYKAPSITVFGAVGMLTQAGSSGNSELMDNGMGMISCSGSMNQQTSSMC